MSPYTVVWLEEARDDLARLWLAASNRQAITSASDEVDRLRQTDPFAVSHHVAEGIWKLHIAPLLFAVFETDRRIEVTNIVLCLRS
jgi:hypothetical protein